MDTVLFAALVWQIVDFLREVASLPTSRSSVVTQATAWLGGIIAVVLAAHSQVAGDLILPGSTLPLWVLDWQSQVLLGLLISSAGSSLVDLKQALDRTDSAAKPPLIGDDVPTPPAA